MENSRLATLITSLTIKELRQLSKFVRSPFFNQRTDIINFFDYLQDCVARGKVIPNKEKAFKKLYPGQPYRPQQIRLVMSQLLKLAEQFLACQEFFEDDIAVRTKVATAFRKRELSKHFLTAIQEVQQKQERQPFRNAEYYTANYQIQQEQYRFTSLGQRNVEQNLQAISDNVDFAFLTTKLRQTCLALSHQSVYKTEYDFGLLQDVLQIVEREDLLSIPSIGLYYYCYHALVDRDKEAYFLKFKSLLFEHEEKFPKGETQGLYLLAINYCIRRLNEGLKNYANEGLSLYKAALQSGALLQVGVLSRFAYRNIIAMGLIVGDYQWVESFLYEYKSALDKSHRETMFNFNLAKLEYTRKNYDVALDLLNKSIYKDLLLNLAVKTMALKIYYEIGEFRLLDSHLQAMKVYIIRKKIIGYHRTNYLNLVRYTQKLVELNFYDKKAIQELKKSIAAEELVSEKNWLLAQLEMEKHS